MLADPSCCCCRFNLGFVFVLGLGLGLVLVEPRSWQAARCADSTGAVFVCLFVCLCQSLQVSWSVVLGFNLPAPICRLHFLADPADLADLAGLVELVERPARIGTQTCHEPGARLIGGHPSVVVVVVVAEPAACSSCKDQDASQLRLALHSIKPEPYDN